MKKLIVMEYLTVDGVMEAPERWQFPYLSNDFAEFNKSKLLSLEVLLLGKTTYAIFAASWPQQTKNEFGIADKLNGMKKFVVSDTPIKAEWNNTKVIDINVIEQIAKLKQSEDGDIGIVGSAQLIQSLIPHNLIDEYILTIHPLVLGKGKRLFDDKLELKLKLSDVKRFESGVVALTYEASKFSPSA